MEAVDLLCFKCKHFNEIEGGCAAFGDDIPDIITSGEILHLEPLPEQANEIVFEPIDA